MSDRSMTGVTAEEWVFICEMYDGLVVGQPPPWRTFDPDFLQKNIQRLFSRGYFEKRMIGGLREYRFAAKGLRTSFSRPVPPALPQGSF